VPVKHHRRGLATARKSAGCSQERLAELLGVERSTVARWERAETEPQPWLRPKLARVLGIDQERLTTLLAEVITIDDPPPVDQRRAVLVGRHRADVATAHHLHDKVRALASAYETQPSTLLLSEASETHAYLSIMLDGASGKATVAALRTAMTASAMLLGQLTWDASGRRDGTATMKFCEQAIATAQASGDTVSEANAKLRISFVHLYGDRDRRDPRRGQAAAEAATDTSQATSPAVTGLALLHVAEALAMQNEYRQTEQALGAAQEHFGRVSDDDLGLEHFSASQYGRLSGSCYLSLNNPDRAQEILRQTEQSLVDRPKSRSLVVGNLALSFIRQRDLDGATSTLHRAIDLVEETRGSGGMSVVFAAGRELYPWRHEPVVQDVTDRLLALMAKN
jgi:transcriptional regulator with XRE-family HTH domain